MQDPYQPPTTENTPVFDDSRPLFSNPFTFSAPAVPAGQRLFQNWGVQTTWITSDDGPHRMGLFRLGFDGEIAFPIFALEHPLCVVPHFAINYWDGPESDVYDMPPQTFDTSLGLSWKPSWNITSLNKTIDFDLFFSVGIYADFRRMTGQSFRFPSWAYGSLLLTKNIRLKLGVYYLDRVRCKILPSGGLIWTPNSQWRFEFLFPNPRVVYRPGTTNLNNLEFYARGEYGGGSWTIKHHETGFAERVERVDYNDYRIMLGGNWNTCRTGTAYFEIGISFARELYYQNLKRYALDPGFVMEGGLHF